MRQHCGTTKERKVKELRPAQFYIQDCRGWSWFKVSFGNGQWWCWQSRLYANDLYVLESLKWWILKIKFWGGMGVLPACISAYHTHGWYLRRTEDSVEFLETAATGNELPCECWELNPRLLEEQPSPQSHKPYIFTHYYTPNERYQKKGLIQRGPTVNASRIETSVSARRLSW